MDDKNLMTLPEAALRIVVYQSYVELIIERGAAHIDCFAGSYRRNPGVFYEAPGALVCGMAIVIEQIHSCFWQRHKIFVIHFSAH